jgi:hypothetical protein
MRRPQVRIRTILFFIVVIGLLMAMPSIAAQLSPLRPFLLEWDGTTLWLVDDWVEFGPMSVLHHSVKTELPLPSPLTLLRIVVAAGLILASALVYWRRLKNRAKLRETATNSGASEPHAIDGQSPERSGEAEKV